MTLGGTLKHHITDRRFYFPDTRYLIVLKVSFEDEVNRAWKDGDQREVANTHNITWVFEGHHVVRVQGNGPCVFPGQKQILREVDARDVVVMRSFGEQIQLVLSSPQSRIRSSNTRCLVSGVCGAGFGCFLGCPCGNGSLRAACP